MIVIVDGYNLIKQIFHKINGNLENQRNQLIKELGYYKQKKKHSIDQLVLVFDGGFSSHADRQIHNGIVVIFSGNREIADDWIIRYTKKHLNEEMLLVTRDKKLQISCKRYGADPIGVYDFYDIVQNTILEDVEKEFRINNDGPALKQSDYILNDQLEGFSQGNNKALDILMSKIDVVNTDKDEEKFEVKHKKMSKEDKRVYRKLKKL